jgi:hypothetical protein
MAGACIKEEETKDNRRKLGAHYHRAAVHRHKLATTTILIEHGLLNMIAIPRMTAIKEIVDVFVLPKTLNSKEPNHGKFYTCICRETML